jgi:hypothetical protein
VLLTQQVFHPHPTAMFLCWRWELKIWSIGDINGTVLIPSQIKTNIFQSPVTRHYGGAWGERRYSSCSFSTSALDGGEWSATRPSRALPPGKGPPVPIGHEGWVGPRAGLDTEARRKILCLCRGSNRDRPTRSQTLYYLSYRGSQN